MSLSFILPAWPAVARVRAAVTTRAGGVSLAPYASLNLGDHVGDAPEAVQANRRRLREALELPAGPLWLEQVHGTAVCDANALESARTRAPSADAVVSRRAGVVLAIGVADCLPVLFASRSGEAIGAAHAGWRGLASGVLEATIRALGVAPAELLVWLGPAISAAHYEVGADVRDAFLTRDPGAASAFQANARGRWQCDLVALARRRLEGAGVGSITASGLCTYADAESFYSHRRDGRTGRQAALLWLAP